MPARPVDRCQQPWNKGLLVGQKKPLEPKHVWPIRVRLEIARSMRDLAIFYLAIDSKLRAFDLVKLRLDDICSGPNVRRRATIVQKLKPGYQRCGPLAPDTSSQLEFMPVLTFQPANMPGWCIAGLKASA
jgi:hypothetical protein